LGKMWQVVLTALTPSSSKVTDSNRSQDMPVLADVPATAPLRREGLRSPAGWLGPSAQWVFRIARHKMVLVFLGGGLGTIARYLVGKWFNEQPWGQAFPWGTFAINVSGSFILGAAAVVLLERLPPDYQQWYLLIGTGLCGGYTTFSTFEWETYKLVRDGSWWFALANVLGSVLAGFVGILLGVALVGVFFPKR
jgi:fluoride exporter